MKKVKAWLRLSNKSKDKSRGRRAEELKNMRQEKKAYGGKIKINKQDERTPLQRLAGSVTEIASLGTMKPKEKINRTYSFEKNKPTTIAQGVKHKVIDKIGAKNYNKLNDNKGKIAVGLGATAYGAKKYNEKKKEDEKTSGIIKRATRKFIS